MNTCIMHSASYDKLRHRAFLLIVEFTMVGFRVWLEISETALVLVCTLLCPFLDLFASRLMLVHLGVILGHLRPATAILGLMWGMLKQSWGHAGLL